jgi:NMD protein affecting ribosome stability and mRNA decay
MNPPKEKKIKNPPTPPSRRKDYFEAVVQLRNVTPEATRLAFKELQQRKVTISKEEELKNGVDLYVDNKVAAKNLVYHLQKKVGGLVKLSPTLFSRNRQTGKEIYRLTTLFKQFPYKRGEEFDFGGKTYTVLSSNKEVIVQDKETKKKRHIRFTELERAKLFLHHPLPILSNYQKK